MSRVYAVGSLGPNSVMIRSYVDNIFLPVSLLFTQTVQSGLKISVKKRSGAGADGSALKSLALRDVQQQFEGRRVHPRRREVHGRAGFAWTHEHPGQAGCRRTNPGRKR